MPNCEISRATYPEGNYVQYTYDARGNITVVREVAKPGANLPDRISTYTYPANCTDPGVNTKTCNKPIAIVKDGAEWDYTYDLNSGEVATVTAPPSNGVRPTTTYTYQKKYARYYTAPGVWGDDPNGVWKLTTVSSCMTKASCAGTADEIRTTYAYDATANSFDSTGNAKNLLVSSKTVVAGNAGAQAQTTAYTYNAAGDLVSTDGPLAGVDDTDFNRYDTEHHLVGRVEIDPDGQGAGYPALAERIWLRSDSQIDHIDYGTVTSQSDAAWSLFAADRMVAYGYDAYGRKIKQTTTIKDGTTQALTQYSYRADDRLECTAVRMNPAAFSSPPDACTPGAAGAYGPDRISKTLYDPAGQPTSVTMGLGTADVRTESKSYTNNGKVQTVTDGKTNVTTYAYDGFDRLQQTTYQDGSFTYLNYDNSCAVAAGGYTTCTGDVLSERKRDSAMVTYTYDARHNRLTKSNPSTIYTYDNLDRVASVNQGGQLVSRTYNVWGWLNSETSSLGTVGYQYTLAGTLKQVTWPDNFSVTYSSYPNGALNGVLENGTTSLVSVGYDDLGRRTSLSRSGAFTTSYGYDPLSRINSLTHDLAGTANDETLLFAYNPANQITNRVGSNVSYGYNGLYAVDRPYVPNNLNQLTSAGSQALAYDGRGNLRSDGSTYSYDLDNRLMGNSNGSAFAYDGFNRLTQITSGGAVTRLLYDRDHLIGEYDANNNLLRRYVHGFGSDEPLLWYNTGSAAPPTTSRRWLAADQEGSIVAVTDYTGASIATNTYDEYGVPATANLGRFQYTGQATLSEAATGDYYYKSRVYSANLGRFLQTDPVGYDAGDLNLYAYVKNDPTDLTDPTGNIAGVDDAAGIIVGGLVGLGVEAVKDAATGHQMTWGDAAGAVVGGALMGEGVVNAPETGGASVVVAGAVRGGAVGLVSNTVQQGTDIATGTQKGYSVTSAAVSTAVGAATGGVATKVGTVKVNGVSAGRGNWSATARGVATRIANGNASRMSASTAVKGAVGGQVGDAGRTAVGAAADAGRVKACQATAVASCQ